MATIEIPGRDSRAAVTRKRAVVEGHGADYLEAGEGPPLVILTTVFLRAETYRPTVRALARHFRVLAVEMPGSGRSARLDRPWTFERYADWSAAFLDAVGLDRAIVLGHSHSGGVAIAMGARHPGRLDALVLADSVGATLPTDRSAVRLLWRRAVDGLLEFRLGVRTGWHVASNLLRHFRNFLYQLGVSIDSDLMAEAALIPVPTLVAWGLVDHTFPPPCGARLAARIPSARLHYGPGSHDWIILHPDDCALAVAGFAQEIGLDA